MIGDGIAAAFFWYSIRDNQESWKPGAAESGFRTNAAPPGLTADIHHHSPFFETRLRLDFPIDPAPVCPR